MENVNIQLANILGFMVFHSDDMGTEVTMLTRQGTIKSSKGDKEKSGRTITMSSCSDEVELEVKESMEDELMQFILSFFHDDKKTGKIILKDFTDEESKIQFNVEDIGQIVKRDDESKTVIFLLDVDEQLEVMETMDEILAKIAECEGLHESD